MRRTFDRPEQEGPVSGIGLARGLAVIVSVGLITGACVWVLADGDGIGGGTCPPAPESGPGVSRIHIGDRVSGVAAGEGAIWVLRHLGSRGAGDIVEIDPASGKVVGEARPLKGSTGGLAVGEGGVWVATGPFDQDPVDVQLSSVLRVDPTSGELVAQIQVPGGASGSLAVGSGAVWVTNAEGDSLSRINPSTNRVEATIAIGDDPEFVTTGAGAVWVQDEQGLLHRIDPSTNRVTGRADLGLEAVGRNALWVIGPWAPNGALRRVDPVSLRPVGPFLATDILPASVAVAGRQVWVGKYFFFCEHHHLGGPPIISFAWFRLDPRTLEPLSGPVYVGSSGSAVFGKGAFWIDDDIGDAVIRLNPSVAGKVRPIPTPGLPSPAFPS
jgi:YVTN family beta-propeller protein